MVLANLSTVWQLIYLQCVSQFIFRVSVNLSTVWQLIYLQGVSQFIFRVSVNLSAVWQLIYLQGVSQFIFRVSVNLSTVWQLIYLQGVSQFIYRISANQGNRVSTNFSTEERLCTLHNCRCAFCSVDYVLSVFFTTKNHRKNTFLYLIMLFLHTLLFRL